MWIPTSQFIQRFTPVLRTLTTRLPNCTAPYILRSFHAITGLSTNSVPSFMNPATVLRHQPQQVSILQSTTPLLQLSCGFKVRGLLKRRCKDCYYVIRQNRGYIICKTHPRHKQMAMVKRPENKWLLTHATQSKVRPW